MNAVEQIHASGRRRQRLLRGEPVILRDGLGEISAEISDAVVTVESPAAVRDSGPVEYTGILRIAAEHHEAASRSLTAEARGWNDWNILSVGAVYAGTFRVEISRLDDTHSNQFDLNQDQAEWR